MLLLCYDTFVIAVGSLDIFIRGINKYNSLEKIPEEVEEQLLQVLKPSHILDGRLTEEISGKIRGEPYPAKSTSIMREKDPRIIYKHTPDKEKEWIRF